MYSPSVLQAALVRGLSILSKVPLIVTLIDLGVGPVFQNDLSCRCVSCVMCCDGSVCAPVATCGRHLTLQKSESLGVIYLHNK